MARWVRSEVHARDAHCWTSIHEDTHTHTHTPTKTKQKAQNQTFNYKHFPGILRMAGIAYKGRRRESERERERERERSSDNTYNISVREQDTIVLQLGARVLFETAI